MWATINGLVERSILRTFLSHRQTRRTLGLITAAVVALAAPARAQCLPATPVPGITNVAGQVRPIQMPLDLRDGATVCNTAAYIFRETTAVHRPVFISGNISGPGHFDANNQPPAGVFLPSYLLPLDTYMVHFDSTGIEAVVEGSVSFEQEVLGLITRGNNQLEADAIVGVQGVPYPPDAAREVEWDRTQPGGPPISFVELSPDRHTVTFRLRVDADYLDQFRIITGPPGVPSCVHIFGNPVGGTSCGQHHIAAGNMQYDNCHIVVQNCATLTIEGEHNFASLRVLDTATLTHTAASGQLLSLAIAGDVSVESQARIDLDGRGHSPGQGEGAGTGYSGGSHGGRGGPGAAASGNPGSPGPVYGSVTQPVSLGSGGGVAAGGGAIRIAAGGTMTIDGVVTANGNLGTGSGGSGSGGSISLSASVFAGTGTITADGGGGTGSAGHWTGAGGGGRIAVQYSTSTFSGQLRAFGGTTVANAARHGGPGTLYLRAIGAPRGTIIIAGASTTGEGCIINGAFDADMVVADNGKVGVVPGQPMDLSVTGDMTVAPAAVIDATGRGNGPSQGEGAGTGYSGGSHGGRGGPGAAASGNPGSPGPVYGSVTQPVSLGSGGGVAAGGGAIRIAAGGTMTVDGVISADGHLGTGSGGSGSGGSICLSAGVFGGSGLISADGGGGTGGAGHYTGAGGGGRIAVEYSSRTFSGQLRAFGGTTVANAARHGGPGTIYLKTAGVPVARSSLPE